MKSIIPIALLALMTAPVSRAVISIQFDFTHDTGGFFSDPTHGAIRTSLLNSAGSLIGGYLEDNLWEIAPSGGNTWSATFFNPSGSGSLSYSGAIPENTLLIFVGAQALGGSTLAQAGAGGYSWSGSLLWGETVAYRGQPGAADSPATDFARWGGSMSFNSAFGSWRYDTDPDPNNPDSGFAGYDFYSVVLHELGHVLGIGGAESWTSKISGNTFTGAASSALYGSAVPTYSADGNAHWAEDTSSFIYGTSTVQEAAMDPDIAAGQQKFFTSLDFAGLQDIGWQVAPVPEPEHYGLAAGALLVAWGMRRRRGDRSCRRAWRV